MSTFTTVALDDPRVAALLADLDAEMGRRYPGSEPRDEADDSLGPVGGFLVDHARAPGLARVVLQTGLGQPEAVRLHETEGWTPIPVYGQYRDDPRCRCYELLL